MNPRALVIPAIDLRTDADEQISAGRKRKNESPGGAQTTLSLIGDTRRFEVAEIVAR